MLFNIFLLNITVVLPFKYSHDQYSHQRETLPVWVLSETFFTAVSPKQAHQDSHQRESIPVWALSEMFFTSVSSDETH